MSARLSTSRISSIQRASSQPLSSSAQASPQTPWLRSSQRERATACAASRVTSLSSMRRSMARTACPPWACVPRASATVISPVDTAVRAQRRTARARSPLCSDRVRLRPSVMVWTILARSWGEISLTSSSTAHPLLNASTASVSPLMEPLYVSSSRGELQTAAASFPALVLPELLRPARWSMNSGRPRGSTSAPASEQPRASSRPEVLPSSATPARHSSSVPARIERASGPS